jgi:hypothetical protein
MVYEAPRHLERLPRQGVAVQFELGEAGGHGSLEGFDSPDAVGEVL